MADSSTVKAGDGTELFFSLLCFNCVKLDVFLPFDTN